MIVLQKFVLEGDLTVMLSLRDRFPAGIGGFFASRSGITGVRKGGTALEVNACTSLEIKQAIRAALPHTAKWVIRLFSSIAGHL